MPTARSAPYHQWNFFMMPEDINAKLQRNRDAIDAIDTQVVELLNQRVLQDGGRTETEVLEAITHLNPGPLSDATIQAIYRTLMLAGLAPGAVRMEPAEVDVLDRKIIRLLSERVQHAGEIGEIKTCQWRGITTTPPARPR